MPFDGPAETKLEASYSANMLATTNSESSKSPTNAAKETKLPFAAKGGLLAANLGG